MEQGLLGAEAHVWVELEEAVEEVDDVVVEGFLDVRLQLGLQVLGQSLLEVRVVLWQGGDAGPGGLVRGPHLVEDELELLLVVCAGEQRLAGDHLREDAPAGPYVDGRGVRARAHEHVRRTVPQRDHLARECVHGDPERTRQPEVAQLQLPALRDQQVLRLQVPVQDLVLVAERQPLQQLPLEVLHQVHLQPPRSVPNRARVHVLLQVVVHVLKHQRKLVLCVYHIIQPHNVVVLKLLHQ